MKVFHSMWCINTVIKRASFCWLFLLLLCCSAVAQNTFSVRHYAVYGTTYCSVQVLPDGYLVGGNTIDSVPGTNYNQYAFNTVKFGLNGEVLFEKIFDDSNTYPFIMQHSLSYLDNLYLQHSISIDGEGNNRATLTW